VQIPVDYRCFEIPDRFVVGFGLDYQQLYRNLRYVAVLNPEPMASNASDGE
jgi:hypoxanthine phosphoribosyltransferase